MVAGASRKRVTIRPSLASKKSTSTFTPAAAAAGRHLLGPAVDVLAGPGARHTHHVSVRRPR